MQINENLAIKNLIMKDNQDKILVLNLATIKNIIVNTKHLVKIEHVFD